MGNGIVEISRGGKCMGVGFCRYLVGRQQDSRSLRVPASYSANGQAPRWSCFAFASNSASFARYARESLPSWERRASAVDACNAILEPLICADFR